MIEKYGDRIIAFIDLQGFSKKVETIADEKDFKSVLHLLKSAKLLESREDKNNFFQSFKNTFSEDEIKQMADGFQCTAISDSIIVSYPCTSASLAMLIIELALMQWDLLWKWNYLIRGYISIGRCHHKEGVIFGQGYMDAYNGAENDENHKNPCIAFDKKILSVLNQPHREMIDPTLVREYRSNFSFVNYGVSVHFLKDGYTNKKISGVEQIDRFESFVRKELLANKNDEKVTNKYFWTLNYLEALEIFKYREYLLNEK